MTNENTVTQATARFVADQSLPWEPVAGEVTRRIMTYDANLMLVKVTLELCN